MRPKWAKDPDRELPLPYSQVRQFERYSEVTSTVKSSVFNGLYDLELLIHEISVITHMDHKAIDNR